MTDFRVDSLAIFESRPMPNWGGDMSDLKFEDIFYYMKASAEQVNSWDDVPEDIRRTYDRLGIPKKLDELDQNLSDKRIVAPERFIQVLEKIYQDQSLMHLARKEAKNILSKIQKMQELSN